MNTEKEIQLREAEVVGRQADHVLSLVKPYLDDLKHLNLQRMLSKFRNGEDDVRAELGAYTTLEDLENQIDHKIRSGKYAGKELAK